MYELLRIALILLSTFQILIFALHLELNTNVYVNDKEILKMSFKDYVTISFDGKIDEENLLLYTTFSKLKQDINLVEFNYSYGSGNKKLTNESIHMDQVELEEDSLNYNKRLIAIDTSGYNKIDFLTQIEIEEEEELDSIKISIVSDNFQVKESIHFSTSRSLDFEFWGHGDLTPFIAFLSLLPSMAIIIMMINIKHRKND
ncbi:MAG: hypothetical protein ACE364_12045 [Chlorobiota bacterium]